MASTYELIASQTLGSDTASVTFSSIPGTYDDLVLTGSARTSTTATADNLKIRFNGASTDTNHTARRLYANGATAASDTGSLIWAGPVTAASSTANTFGSFEIYIPNYSGSTYKSLSGSQAQENNTTTAYLYLVAGLWSDTSAINQIELLPFSNNIVTGSSFYLYGITKA